MFRHVTIAVDHRVIKRGMDFGRGGHRVKLVPHRSEFSCLTGFGRKGRQFAISALTSVPIPTQLSWLQLSGAFLSAHEAAASLSRTPALAELKTPIASPCAVHISGDLGRAGSGRVRLSAHSSVRDVDGESHMTGRTSDLGEWTAYGVDPPVKILQVGEIRGVETLDDLRSHLIVLETAKRGDHSGEEHHGQVVGIGLDPVVKQRQQFVASRRQPHDSDPMEGASAVEIAPWELEFEFEFRLQRWHRLLGIS